LSTTRRRPIRGSAFNYLGGSNLCFWKKIYKIVVVKRFYWYTSELMRERELELLRKADWDEISARLLHWVDIVASRRPLPCGFDSEEIVRLAVGKLWSEDRDWDSEKHPDLLAHLKWIVKSLLSNKGLYALKDAQKVEFTDDPATLDPPVESETDALGQDEQVLAWQALEEEFVGDKEMQLYLAMIRKGEDKPSRISELTGIPVARVYELPRKLDTHLPSVRARIITLSQKGFQE
jgi:hypothetical protein